jgi:segregation and condensation protein A
MTFAPNVTLNNFEGPLDLLLFLIQKEEIDVYDIPLHELTRKFLLGLLEEYDRKLDFGAEFVSGTSLLLLLKSKRLVPKEVLPEDIQEDTSINLLKDLIEYCTFKEIAKRLAEVEEKNHGYFERGIEPKDNQSLPLAPSQYSIDDLSKILNKLLLKKTAEIRTISDESFKIEERISYLRESFKKSKTLFFDDIFSSSKSKDELIATFLAVLQLLKGQELKVTNQDNRLQFTHGTR